MAVQILNHLPDAAINRGEPLVPKASAPQEPPRNIHAPLSQWVPTVARAPRGGHRALFIAITVLVHGVAAIGLLSMRQDAVAPTAAPPITVQMIDVIDRSEDLPPVAVPMQPLAYVLPAPEPVAIELDSQAPARSEPVAEPATPPVSATLAAPPLVESVEYVRPPLPVYPRESSRRHEYGTVLLRVLVDAAGRAEQIRIERSSGYERLDVAARQAVERALFRPFEVNGVRQPAQVLIPVEFARRAT